MKRCSVLLLLIICMVLVLCSCGKNEYVENVESLINDIGTVTASSGSKIKEAREKYDALTDADKAKVTNYYTLTDAESAFKKIDSEHVKANIDSALEKIESAKLKYDDMIPVVMAKWESAGFTRLFTNGDMNGFTQEFKDLCSDFKKSKGAADNDLTTANTKLSGISGVPDEYKEYFNATRDAYATVKTYGSLTDYPEGYSQFTYKQSYASYKSNAESAINAASIKK